METFKDRRAIARTTQLTLIRMRDVIALCGMSRSSIYIAIKHGDFPEPVAIGDRARAWIKHEVENWVGKRIRTTRSPRTLAPLNRSSASPPARAPKGR